MKIKTLFGRKSAAISKSRWAAYATAGAATAFGCAKSAEADIHYMYVNQMFNAPPGTGQTSYFALDQAADRFGLEHFRTSGGTLGGAKFNVHGIVSGAFVGLSSAGYRYVSKLDFGQNISTLAFVPGYAAFLASGDGYPNSQWLQPGTGFIGFKFDNGSGVEYGWARITMDSGTPGNTFTLVDYAWGDVGDHVTAGQIPEPGSLGLLALGGASLLAWRKRRKNEAQKREKKVHRSTDLTSL